MGRDGQGRHCVRASEAVALGGERIDVRARLCLVAIGAQGVRTERVEREHDHVRRGGVWGGTAGQREHEGDEAQADSVSVGREEQAAASGAIASWS